MHHSGRSVLRYHHNSDTDQDDSVKAQTLRNSSVATLVASQMLILLEGFSFERRRMSCHELFSHFSTSFNKIAF